MHTVFFAVYMADLSVVFILMLLGELLFPLTFVVGVLIGGRSVPVFILQTMKG